MQYGVMAEMEKLEFKSSSKGSDRRRGGEFNTGGLDVLSLLARQGGNFISF
jgi:hypothetical protein